MGRACWRTGFGAGAIGEDPAYRYGGDRNLAQLDFATAFAVLGDPDFAVAAQAVGAVPAVGRIGLLNDGLAEESGPLGASVKSEAKTPAHEGAVVQPSMLPLEASIGPLGETWFVSSIGGRAATSVPDPMLDAFRSASNENSDDFALYVAASRIDDPFVLPIVTGGSGGAPCPIHELL